MSKTRTFTNILGDLLVVSLLALASCGRLGLHRASSDESAPTKHSAPVVLSSAKLELRAASADTHRIVLDARTLTRLGESARLRTPAFLLASARADEALASKPISSGYQGFEWAEAVAGTALLWNATRDPRYAGAAVRYLNGLLDDRLELGDGKGGADVVSHDSGYGMRTFGAYSALAYDWLRGAPGMDDALRARVLARLDQWLTWYAKEGYLRDHPTANYYWGYLTTLTFAGLAAGGEAKVADEWSRTALGELSSRVLPAFNDDLPGGGWPEGWQYGEYTTLEIALVAQAWRTGAGIDVASKLPWLGQTVTHHVHALLPDEQSVYDGGTWGEHPALPSGVALAALSIALEGVDDARAAEARWMTAHALPALKREQAWLGLLAERPGAAESSPRGGATSLSLTGQGLTFVRSDWSDGAVWGSFQAGPRLAEDHQDADQGHFELFRGADGLLVDGGGSEGSATINHNTLLVDDAGKTLNYPPNQGVWGTKVKTTRFADDGLVAVAVGDIGEAYAPSCAPDGCRKRSVELLTRTFVFVRPSLLVIDDHVLLARPEYGLTWAAHLTQNPVLSGNLASAMIGASRVDVRTLEPREAEHSALHEPTPSGEGSHRLDQPWGPMWRLEVTSPRGARERNFLHFISASARADAPPEAHRSSGDGLRGGVGRVAGRAIAVLFAGPTGEGHVTLDREVELVVIAGLVPGQRYGVSIDGTSCVLRLARASGAADLSATRGGFLRTGVTQCGVK
jgi:Heparinase II/III-like protein